MDINQKIVDIARGKDTKLPTMPVIIDNILTAVRDDRTSAKDLAEFIIKDQAISNKVLKLANSAYYGLMREVDSIPRAITVIGFNEVIGLTIGMSVFSALGQNDMNGLLDMKELWLHSIACATAAKKVAQKTRSSEVDKIFLCGLLHDMGKVILAVYLPDEYREVFEKAKTSEMPLYRTEKKILGTNHAMLSGLLMKRWHFPDSLLLPSRFHHGSVSCSSDYKEHAMIVEFADFLSQKAEIGSGGNPVLPNVEKISGRLGVSSEEMEMFVTELKDQRSEIEEFFDLIT